MFTDRVQAGRMLGAQLSRLELLSPVVLAAPRGGVPVGAEVARILDADLDLALVRKLRHPLQLELALGAVGEFGDVVLNREIAGAVPQKKLDEEIARRRDELADRARLYRTVRKPIDIHGRDVVLVDDGVATGATMEAAIHVAKSRGARRVIAALPVAPPEARARLASLADRVICLESSPIFHAVASFYQSFPQTSDEEVIAILRRFNGPVGQPPAASPD